MKLPRADFWNCTMPEFWAILNAVEPPQPEFDHAKMESMVDAFKDVPVIKGNNKNGRT